MLFQILPQIRFIAYMRYRKGKVQILRFILAVHIIILSKILLLGLINGPWIKIHNFGHLQKSNFLNRLPYKPPMQLFYLLFWYSFIYAVHWVGQDVGLGFLWGVLGGEQFLTTVKSCAFGSLTLLSNINWTIFKVENKMFLKFIVKEYICIWKISNCSNIKFLATCKSFKEILRFKLSKVSNLFLVNQRHSKHTFGCWNFFIN